MEKTNKVQITEYGAAETVPGSKLIFEFSNEKRILEDMGLEYRKGEENDALPFSINGIECVVLTHAHADHIGQLPKLYQAGFRRKIYGTFPTVDITKLQLQQQAVGEIINRKRAQYLQNKGIKIPLRQSSFSYRDQKDLAKLFECSREGQPGFPYGQKIDILKDKETEVKATFYEAGHIPGSAQVLFEIKNNGKNLKILTACDLGRTDYKILNHPVADIPIVKFPYTDFPKDIDAIIIEATYGNRVHAPLEDSIKTLEDAAKDTKKNNGKLIIPTFSIMRSHILQYFLYNLRGQERLPENMMFYLSCPSSDAINRVILKYTEDLDEKAKKEFANKYFNPFQFDRLIRHRDVNKTKELLAMGDLKNPYGIIASSGMCEGGRIERILQATLSDPKNIILLTGYQSPGTRGYLLKNGETKIPFLDRIVERKAEVRKMGGLSGHADIEELVAHVKNIYDPKKDKREKPFKVFIKHGEKESCEAVRTRLIKESYKPEEVIVMKKGKQYEV